jgi:AraC-like DNA-binding protein
LGLTRSPIKSYIGDIYYPVSQFPLAVVRSRIPHLEPMHTHDFAEIVFVRSGSANHSAERSEESPRITAGDVVLIAQGERHAYTNSSDLVIDNLMFRHDLLSGHTREAAVDAFAIVEPLFRLPVAGRIVTLTPVEQTRAWRLLDDLRAELDGRLPGFRAMTMARFVECLVIVGRAATRERPPLPAAAQTASGSSSAIGAAVEFMRVHFPEPLTLQEIAATANLTEHHFCDVFKRHMGETPWQFLQKLRLEHAAYLLTAHPTMPIAHVASAAGFADPGYFGRTFRAKYGAAPSAYRNAKAGT